MYYRVRTRAGAFELRLRGEFWDILFREESLGSYHSPEAAIDDLVGGHTFSCGVDTSTLGISDELSDWECIA